MDETKVQIGDDILLDIGTHSDWYISVICYNNESVNVELRRKTDRNNKWWVAEQTENSSEFSNNWEDFFREPTAEERKAVADYIDSISVPTGVNVFDLMDEPQKSCSTCGYSTQSPSCDSCEGYSNWWSLEDEPQTCDTCKYGEDKHRYAHICNECGVGINNYKPKDEPTISKMEQVDEPQTKDYCNICNHKGCEYCISDSRNPYCIPSNYEPRTEGNER